MKRKTSYQFILIVCIILFSLSENKAALPSISVEQGQAASPGPNLILGFIRTLEAINKRNQIYREAGRTANEINAYYDTLIENAKKARDQRIKEAARGEKTPTLIGGYVRIEAALEAERAAAIQQIEAEKKGARAAFKEIIKKEVINMLTASPGAQKLLGDIRETIDGARQAAIAVRNALSANLPTEALANQFADRFGKIPGINAAAHYLGSKIASQLYQQLGNLGTWVENPAKMVISELDDALLKMDQLDYKVVDLQNKKRTPYSILEVSEDLSGFKTLKPSGEGVDAVAVAYATKAARLGLLDGTGLTSDQLRERIRAALLGARVSTFRETVRSLAKYAYCIPGERKDYLKAMGELGLTPEEPLDPGKAGYIVCYVQSAEEDTKSEFDLSSSLEVVHAFLIGDSKEDQAAQPSPEVSGGESPGEGDQLDQADAASCDALEFISFELVEGPIEETTESGSYHCHISYSITNTHESSQIVISWRHDDSSSSRGPYWTRPKLGPGESYYVPLTIGSHKSENGKWSHEDANYLMAWFASMECDRYQNQFWPTEEKPDLMLQSGFQWIEIENPCRR